MALPGWLQAVIQLVPTVLAVIPGFPTALVPVITQAIQDAEQIPGATGPQKKAYVQQIAGDAVTVVNSAHGSTVLDPAATSTVVGQGIDTGVAVVNLVHGHS